MSDENYEVQLDLISRHSRARRDGCQVAGYLWLFEKLATDVCPLAAIRTNCDKHVVNISSISDY